MVRLNETITEVDALLEKFEFAKAMEILYHFAWDDLCDWYLELTKSTFAGSDSAQTARVLGYVLDNLLRLLHPAMPFITEAIWCNLTGNASLVISDWPKAHASHNSDSAKKSVAQIQEIITEIRRFRNDQGIKTSAKIVAKFTGLGELADYEDAIRFIVRADRGDGPYSAKIELGSVLVEFDLTGAIDIKAERARLTKDLATAQKDLATAKVKLENEGFMAKAPLEVVTEIRERLEVTTSEITRITAALAALPAE